jgi:signal transduction histidine kinase
MEPHPMALAALIAALLVAVCVAAGIASHRRQRRALLAARAERDAARAGEAEAVRVLRLAAIELRGPATTLLGHADRLRADGPGVSERLPPGAPVGVSSGTPVGATVGAIARQVLDLADDLQHHALADAASRVLREEPIPLAALLRDAVAAVQASLDPGRRHWRLPPRIDAIEVIADRRALAQILARVLASAARFSRHDDWIDISLEIAEDRFALIVADEGDGRAAAEGTGVPGHADSRGLGLGLALARVLMEAHDGALHVESAPSIGTRVTLDFPRARLVRGVAPDASIGTAASALSGVGIQVAV